jgi:ferric iron reductase protein FhuF
VTQAGVLGELARLGPFFALESHPAQSSPVLPWRPLEELFQQPAALQAQVAAVRSALAEASGQSAGAVELRVAASMAQLGLAARLICPALGVAVLTGGLLEVDPARMRWQPGAGGAVALSIRGDVIAPAGDSWQDPMKRQDPASLAGALAGSLLAGPVRALVEASRPFGVSKQVLWGNVASVVHGAVALIDTAAPGLAGQAEVIAAGLLNQPPLQDSHQGSGPGAFRRRSCCLVYRLTALPAPVCGDCVLNRAPVRWAPVRP